jgi:hypothetical protein
MTFDPTYRVFISYTGADLEEHAKVVSDVVKQLANSGTSRNWVAVDHKSWAPTGRPSVPECMKEVSRCQVLVVLVAFRYGWVPTAGDGGDGESSITRMEVEQARKLGIEVIPLLVRDNAPWNVSLVEGITDPIAQKRLDRFKGELRETLSGFFDTPDSLRDKTLLALQGAAERIERSKLPVEVSPSGTKTTPSTAAAQPHLSLTRRGLVRRAIDRVAPRLHVWMIEQLDLVSDPPERAILTKALRELAVAFENDIDKRVVISGQARETPREARRVATVRPIRQLIREIAGLSGGDAADAVISALSKRSAPVRNLLRTLRRSREPVILLGEPGAGKSLTLQRLAVAFARREEKRAYPCFCVFVRLGSWLPVQAPNADSVRELVAATCPQDVRPYLNDLERQRRLMVIFDGMDEMSRQLYIEHTAALNDYAAGAEGYVQTLFSCRIADFAPNFRHRRLVLMPFDKAHVRDYLIEEFHVRDYPIKRFMKQEKIEIDGAWTTASQLAHRLTFNDYGIRATNPYVLHLLCLFIKLQKKLPATRVQLMRHYLEYAIAREENELGTDGLPSNPDKLFRLWGKVALMITEANRGSYISRADVDLALGSESTAAIRSGQIVGIMEEIPGDDRQASRLIRFDSHRLQEYFTASAIAGLQAPFDWTRRIDIPRWQETLVNAVQMGAGGESIAAVEQALKSVPKKLSINHGQVNRIEIEAEVAERVALAARIMRELPPSEQRVRLKERLSSAVGSMIKLGNGVSVAEALHAIQQSPEIGSLELISPAFGNPSGWVRDQAYVVGSRLAGADSEGSALGEIELAFVEKRLLERLPRYIALAGKLRSLAVGISSMSGAVFLLIALLTANLVGPFIYILLSNSDVDLGKIIRELTSDWAKALVIASLVVSLIATAFAWSYSRINVIAYAVAGSSLSYIVYFVGRYIWINPSNINVANFSIGLGLTIILLILLVSWCTIIDTAITVIITFLYACLIRAVSQSSASVLFSVCTKSIGDFIKGTLFLACWFLGFGLWTGSHVEALLGLALLSGLLIINRGEITGYMQQSLEEKWKKVAQEVREIIVGLVVSCVFLSAVFGISYLIWVIAGFIDRKLGEWEIFVPYVALFAIVALVASAIAFLTYRACKPIVHLISNRIEMYTSRHVTATEWCRRINESQPHEQARLIRSIEPTRLGLDLEGMISLLGECKGSIKQEPALSALDSKLYELIVLRRQKRAG